LKLNNGTLVYRMVDLIYLEFLHRFCFIFRRLISFVSDRQEKKIIAVRQHHVVYIALGKVAR
jgi:hypothetical protein